MIQLPALALTVLKSRALWYAVGLLAVVSVIFVGGCNYGASGKKALQEEFDTYKEAQVQLLVQVAESNKKDAVRANDALKATERTLEENHRKQQRELAAMRKKLDAVQLNADLVRLLNSSATPDGTDQPPTGPQVKADGSVDEDATSGAGPPTLGDLAELTITNNKNHLACIEQVNEWQKFYINLYERFE